MILPVKIETDRLLLRPFRRADTAAFIAFMASPVATRYLSFGDAHKSPGGAAAIVDEIVRSYATDIPMFVLVVEHRSRREYLGACGLIDLGRDRAVEIFYTIVPNDWRNGYATEAVAALVGHVATLDRFETIVADILPANVAARRVSQKCGFICRGRIENGPTRRPMLRYSYELQSVVS